MRKRLRKKLARREFAEWGFEVTATVLAPTAPPHDAPRQAWDAYHEPMMRLYYEFEDFLDSRALSSGGAIGAEWNLVVSSTAHRGSATDDDREAVADWLRSQRAVLAFEVSEPMDVNNVYPIRRAFKRKRIAFSRSEHAARGGA